MSKFLYFVQEAGRGCVKIGVTADPVMRLKQLRNANPYPLQIVGCAKGTTITERSLHRRFNETRLEGEWFAPSGELLHLISKYPSWDDYQGGAELPVADQDQEVLVAMYNDGFTYGEIGNVLNISRSAVEQQARALNLPPRRTPRKSMSIPSQ